MRPRCPMTQMGHHGGTAHSGAHEHSCFTWQCLPRQFLAQSGHAGSWAQSEASATLHCSVWPPSCIWLRPPSHNLQWFQSCLSEGALALRAAWVLQSSCCRMRQLPDPTTTDRNNLLTDDVTRTDRRCGPARNVTSS